MIGCTSLHVDAVASAMQPLWHSKLQQLPSSHPVAQCARSMATPTVIHSNIPSCNSRGQPFAGMTGMVQPSSHAIGNQPILVWICAWNFNDYDTNQSCCVVKVIGTSTTREVLKDELRPC